VGRGAIVHIARKSAEDFDGLPGMGFDWLLVADLEGQMALHCTALYSTALHCTTQLASCVTYSYLWLLRGVVADWLESIDGFPLFNVLVSLTVQYHLQCRLTCNVVITCQTDRIPPNQPITGHKNNIV
jgi:hypothetical protein